MIEIIKELNIEVSKPNVFQAVVAKQYDMNTRFIKATFVDGGDKIYIDPNATVSVVINALRADGESKGFDGVVNNDGTVTVPIHSWMLELEGTVICDISVIDTETDDNKKLTTTSFTLLVEKAAYGGEGITSDPQYDLLVELLDRCSEADEMAKEALENSKEANSKYDACVEATERANNAASGVVTIEQNSQSPLKFWVGTQEEYNAIPSKYTNMFYLISDDTTEAEFDADIEEVKTAQQEINAKNDEIVAEFQNYVPTDLTSQLQNVDSKLAGKFELIKSGGNVVNLSLSIGGIEFKRGTWELCTLPEGLRPKTEKVLIPYVELSSDYGSISPNGGTYILIRPNGKVFFAFSLKPDQNMVNVYFDYFAFNITYIAAEVE